MKRAVLISTTGLVVMMAFFICPDFLKAEEPCPSEAGFSYICGPASAEDLVHVAGTHWIIGSGMGENNSAGKLLLIDTEQKSWETLYPEPGVKNALDAAAYPTCPGPPDANNFSPHGIAIRNEDNRKGTLLAVNHGREAIEAFRVDASGDKPAIRWIGCVPMGEDIFVNSVAFLPEGGMAFTKFFDPRSPEGFRAIMEGKTTGGVYEWHPDTGINALEGTELAGANGIEVSADGRSIYVAAWGTRELVRFSLSDGTVKKDAVNVDFMPDNLRWSPGGKILVAGQVPASVAPGNLAASAGWIVVHLDPKTLQRTEVASDPGESPLQNASVAIEVDGVLWIGSFRADRVAYKTIQDSQ